MPDVKQCKWASPHTLHNWTEQSQGSRELLLYHVCMGVQGTTLDGAINEPPPESITGDAGEFAARWNTATPEQREQRWQRIQQAFDVSNRCFQEDHEALLEQLRSSSARQATAISEIQGLLDSLDDHITQDEIYSALKDIKEAL